jgi:Tfp pilus assembly protein PilF
LEDLKQGERVHLLRGRRAFSSGDYSAAASEFKKATLADPSSARAMVNLGTALARVGQQDKALDAFRKATKLDPKSATAHFNLGTMLESQGDYVQATEQLRQAIAIEPDDSLAHWELAEALRGLGDWEAALEHYSIVQTLHPAREEPLLESTKMLLHLSRYQEALERLEEAHRKMPQKGRIAHALARLLAASPDTTLRDGSRALDLSLQVYKARSTVTHAETVALALAELGHCAQAADWQRNAVGAAKKAQAAALSARLLIRLRRYETEPCRPP